MKTFVLITHIQEGNRATILKNVSGIIGRNATMLANPGADGLVHVIAFTSSQEATQLSRAISDFIHGSNSFLILEAGKDWAAVNLETARAAWLRKNVNAQEFLGESRATNRG